MPAGFQVWDANGRPVIEVTDRLPRVLGMITTTTVDGSHPDPRLATGEPWVVAVDSNNTFSQNGYTPRVTATSTAVVWTFETGSDTRRLVTVLYGVY